MKILLTCVVVTLAAISNNAGADRQGMPAFSFDDDRLHFEDSGQGFPLVLVSGGSGMDLRQWHLVAPALAKLYRVILYDPRGVGRSDNPTVNYSDTDDLARLLDHLQIEKAGVIGVSSAGGFALEFAVKYPERVAGVVAVAPFVPGFEFADSMMVRLNRINGAAQQGREPFLNVMFEDPHFIPAPLDRSVRISARENMAEQYDKVAAVDFSLQVPLSPPLIEQVSGISSPVLLLAGELDHSEVLRRNKYLLAEIPSAEEKIIDQAGHNAPLENPDAVLEAVRPFLRTISR